MKNTYKQLSSEERDKIAVLRAQEAPFKAIGEAIGRDKSTQFVGNFSETAPPFTMYTRPIRQRLVQKNENTRPVSDRG